jgi:hypothetical protein
VSTLAKSLADLYDVVRPGSLAAAHFRASATAEQAAGRSDVAALADEVRAVLHGIGAPSERAKHDEPTCLKHVECLAERIAGVVDGEW